MDGPRDHGEPNWRIVVPVCGAGAEAGPPSQPTVRECVRAWEGAMAIIVKDVTLPFSGLHIAQWIAPPRGAYAVMGPNGSGKSQWLALLAGQLRVRSGTVDLGGHRVGWVMQQPEHQLSEESVSREILWPFSSVKQGEPAFRQSLDAVKERWGLEDLWEHSVWSLSTGQKRRLVCAVYDFLDPEVFLLDEPTEGLDVTWKSRIRDWIIARSENHLMLIVSHDWPWVLSFVSQGYWCEGVLDNIPQDLGEMWYAHSLPPS
ncbi:MAG: hypothetical protein C7B44_04790, partial [Sulfobacillus thermosulfidooxidans]